MKRLMRGFTMIELLIVIAVLGVLAVAVLSAINPIEQINRGRDTGSRSDAEQLLSAFDRYYTTQEVYPWQDKNTSPSVAAVPLDGADMKLVDVSWLDETGDPDAIVLNKLTTGGTAEIKQSFVSRINNFAEDQKLRIYFRGEAGDSVYICFHPRSGSFRTEALTRCGEDCTVNLPEDLAEASCDVVCDQAAGGVNPYICLP